MENLENEAWLPVVGYENLYEVSDMGRVRSLDRMKSNSICSYKHKGRVLRPGANRQGYHSVILCISNNVEKTASVHRLVSIAFIPNPENKRCVNHKNGIKHDNRVENLEWNTHSENNKHAYDVLNKKHCSPGSIYKGSNHYASKPVVQISLIGEFIMNYESSCGTSKYGFSPSSVSKCCKSINKYHGGFKWMYLSDYEKLKQNEEKN